MYSTNFLTKVQRTHVREIIFAVNDVGETGHTCVEEKN